MKIYCRFIFAWMGFLGLIIVYMLRVNISVAIVAMANSTVFKPKNFTPECPVSKPNNSIKRETGEFLWGEADQTMILSSFYWGYTLVQIPSGILLLFFKPKWIYGLSTLTTSILTFFIPLAANSGVYAMVILRFLMGVCEGPTYPSLYALCGCWVLAAESSIVVTCIMTGGTIGTILGQSLSGLIIEYLGWRWMFYIMAMFGCVWFIGYCLLVFNRPSEHPFISEHEKMMLINSLPHNQPNYKPKRVPLPWKHVFKSRPFFGFLILGATYNFTWYTLINCLPLYIGTVLGFNISENGGISSLPYIALFFFSVSSGIFQDFIKSKKIISNTKLRKIFACFGMTGASIIMFCIIFMGCNIPLTIMLVCLSVAMMGITVSVTGVNLIDIAPAYAGPLLAICNLFNSLCGIIAPYVKGYYTHSGETRNNWANVFITNSSVMFFGAVVFLLFGSSTLQPWAILNCDLEQLVIFSESDSLSSINEDERTDSKSQRNIQ
uniref:Slc17a-6 n=1 Tax=Schmidtea mediterranea TaxID=79327 RepID=A0A0H3YJ71_SCHMD|nr:slc17a-6 [Schmidtea mediterranea]